MGTTTFNKIMLPKKWQCQNLLSDILGFVRSSSTYKNSQSMLHFWTSLWSTCPSKISSPAQQLLQGVPVLQELCSARLCKAGSFLHCRDGFPGFPSTKLCEEDPSLTAWLSVSLGRTHWPRGLLTARAKKRSCRRVETKLTDPNAKQRYKNWFTSWVHTWFRE